MLILSGHKVPYITHTKNVNCKYYLMLTKIYFQIFEKFKQNNSHLFLRNQFWWFQGNSSQLIHLSLLDILSEIWRWYLKILKPAFFPNSEREFLTNPRRWQEYHFWIIKDNTKANLKNYIEKLLVLKQVDISRHLSKWRFTFVCCFCSFLKFYLRVLG